VRVCLGFTNAHGIAILMQSPNPAGPGKISAVLAEALAQRISEEHAFVASCAACPAVRAAHACS